MFAGLAFLLSMLFSLMFVSTAWDKVSHADKHIQSIRAYQLTPEGLIRPLFALFTVWEIGVCLSLPVLGMTPYHTLAVCGLLGIYTMAITINLIRGHRDISCGCGGIMEGNNRLHWGLVLRNTLLIVAAISTYLLQLESVTALPLLSKVMLGLTSVALVMVYAAYQKINEVQARMSRLRKWMV
ncbi:MauE/DoxX family redox-associated membrane protein [Brevibacillus dissolubilis]|uniref:MauE/DoxX family redox-associated membrane protein n=1 Tax=Brevibacillus dissolubilis TaxID=1844116 RepID=UPI0011177E3E|nr:MauE/DoxX family redox-associated membrane protein [Brevibacillus dissolubilis]